MLRKLSVAVALLTVVGIFTPVLASENWPDSIDQYVLQIRKSVKTADMDGYLAAVKNPNGAVLLDVREDEEFKAGTFQEQSTSHAGCWNSASGNCSGIPHKWT